MKPKRDNFETFLIMSVKENLRSTIQTRRVARGLQEINVQREDRTFAEKVRKCSVLSIDKLIFFPRGEMGTYII